MDAILTDVTKTWLDMRTALYCMYHLLSTLLYKLTRVATADYDKTGSQYGRYFLWTTPRWYTPFLQMRSRKLQAALESVAGPFDAAIPRTVEIKA